MRWLEKERERFIAAALAGVGLTESETEKVVGPELRKWKEEEHPRNEDGEFDDKRGGKRRGEPKTRRYSAGGGPTFREDYKRLVSSWETGTDSSSNFLQYTRMRDPKSPEGKQWDRALQQLPDHKGTVYRGLGVSRSATRRFAEGKTISIQKHSSSSKNQRVARDFAAEGQARGQIGVLLKMNAKTGKDISKAVRPGLQGEQEVVLRASARYRITSVTKLPRAKAEWEGFNIVVELDEI